MAAIAREQTSNCANPILDVFFSTSSVLVDVAVLEFQVFDVSTPAKQITPVQVFPATIGAREPVNVAVVCPAVGAGKISTGRFVATWTVPTAEPIGAHRIKWFFKFTPLAPEQTFQEEFEVLLSGTVSGFGGYCTVGDLRDEGVTTSMASDSYLLKRISLASRFIDRATGRFFEPRPLTLKLDGRGGRMLLLDVPIISIETVEYETSPFQPSSSLVDAELMRIYNRHLSQGLTQPDDRNNPKIELYYPGDEITSASPYAPTRLTFPRGQQNVTVKGVFGYTDPAPPSTTGETPELIRHACKLLVMRELPKMAQTAARDDATNRYRLTSERTRDQAYTLEGLGKRTGYFTGDPAIDNILASYMRPPALGAV
jgi:hypothetical protein